MGKKRKNEKAATAVTSDGDGEWTVVTSSRRHAAPPKPQPLTGSKGADTGARAPSSRQFESSVVSIAVPVKPAPVKEPQSGGGDNKDKSSSSSSNKAEGKKTPPPPPAVRVPVPKGMGNPSATLCFMNSVLQALLACEPMRALIKKLGAPRAGAAQPVTRALAGLVAQTREGSPAEQDAAVHRSSVYGLVQFEESVLPQFCRVTGNHAGTQQDAQEWYSFLVTALQEEHAVPASTRPDADAASEWTMVAGRRRSVVLNAVTDFASGPVADVFLGCLESSVRRRGSPAPSVSVQPFECVHLDISHASVASVARALALFQAPESVAPGVSRSTAFAALPQILCLHLKRFIFTLFVPSFSSLSLHHCCHHLFITCCCSSHHSSSTQEWFGKVDQACVV